MVTVTIITLHLVSTLAYHNQNNHSFSHNYNMSVYNTTLINSLGLPITILETGMFCFATCIHPPGAAHRSTHTRDFCRNSNLRFNCISLKAARDLNPKIMKSYLTVVKRIITHVCFKLFLPPNNSWRLRGGWNVVLPSLLWYSTQPGRQSC